MRLDPNARWRALAGTTGALFMTTTLAVLPSTAQSQTPEGSAASAAPKAKASFAVSTVRRHVVAGRRVVVSGWLRPAGAGRAVSLQVRGGKGWTTVDKGRTSATGRYSLRWRAAKPGRRSLRLHFGGTADTASVKRPLGRANIYRRALASWYGPGLYGGHLACGGRLSPGTLGVAHKSLPCGTRVTLRHRGRTVRVRVIDRGPYVGAREFDLTAATKNRLRFSGTGTVLTTR